jgi:hypothetical protein
MTTNVPDAASKMRLLPQLRKLAMWDPTSGLIVSPYTRLLPSRVTWDMADRRIETLSNPRLLEDRHIFLAFYPRKDWYRGALFSPLSHQNLPALIVQTASIPPEFMLSDDVCQAWEELESFLLDVSMHLLSEFPERKYLPDIDYPRWPSQRGYKTKHPSMQAAFESVKDSLQAFRMLSAFVSFTLSLWVGQFEDTCFDRPFEVLLRRTANPFRPIQLDYLRDSVVCDISPGLRPGGFLNPYETRWGRILYRICRFCVPIWMVWGQEEQYKAIAPADRSLKSELFPPEHYIKAVKQRHATFSSLILPDSNFTEAPIGSVTPAPPPPVRRSTSTLATNNSWVADIPDTANSVDNVDNVDNVANVDVASLVDTYRSVQRPGETWESFRTRMEKGLEMRKSVESQKEKQSRESLEANAQKNGYSNKTTVFVWEADEHKPGFYRRTKIDKILASQEWWSCTEHQRFFWSHRREWDLVPHLPRCPPGAPPETPVEDMEIDDPDYNFLFSKPPNPKPIHRQEDEGNILSTGEHRVFFPSLTDYLKDRHGYSSSLIDNWHPELHDADLPKKLHISPDKFKMALFRLGYPPEAKQRVPTDGQELKSIINFVNICGTAGFKKITRLDNLPSLWDLSSSMWLVDGLRHLWVQIVREHSREDRGHRRGGRGDRREDGEHRPEDRDLFIIRPKDRHHDSSTWYIATASSTVVLLVFRRRWFTMRSIAQGLLDLGIPFRTVEERMERDLPSPPPRFWPRGSHVRLEGFTPGKADYEAYIQARDDIFKSPRARVLRLLGGIIGRLALESVPDVVVLDGPSSCDQIVGTTQNSFFVDDFISETDLEMVSGVYRVIGASGSQDDPMAHASWWPSHSVWKRCGLAMDQWLPNAEVFYAQRLAKFQGEVWELKGSTAWKRGLKYDRTQLEHLYGGSEAFAKQFIRRYFA